MTTGTYSGSTTTNVTLSVSPTTIASTGTIDTASGPAVYGTSTSAFDVVNLGSITTSAGFGVQLAGGGSVANGSATDTIALISGYNALNFGNTATLTNYATVTATGASGIAVGMQEDGTVTNGSTSDHSALISGAYGVSFGSAGTVVNFASISGVGAGIALNDGGSVTNASGGIITSSGYYNDAIKLSAGGYVDNAGSIVIFRSLGDPAGSAVGIGFIDGGSGSNTGVIDITREAKYYGGSQIGVLLQGGAVFTNSGYIASGYINATLASALAEHHANPFVVRVTADSATSEGVRVDNSTLTNASAGIIKGYNFGIKMLEGGSIENFGTVQSYLEAVFQYAGTLNNSGVVISEAGNQSAAVLMLGGLVTNSGTIDAVGSYENYGIYARSTIGLTVTNAAGGLIEAQNGIQFDGTYGNTVVNGGTIDASGSFAVVFGNGSDLLDVRAGAAFIGTIYGGGGVNTLELSAGAISIGTLDSFSGQVGSQYENMEVLLVDTGADWALTGTNTIASGFQLINDGSLAVRGSLSIDSAGTFENDGVLKVNGGTLVSGAALTGAGTLALNNAGSAELDGGASGTVKFLDAASTLTLGTTTGVTLDVEGFVNGDGIVLSGVNYAVGDTVTYGAGQVYVSDSGGAIIADVTLSGLAGATLEVVGDSNGHVEIENVVCFLEGTRIRTVRGEIAVEALVEGDLALTASGGLEPVRWIGSRRMDARRHPSPEKVYPIRIKRGAFADNVPARDLLVSPGHAIYAGGILIPAHRLVNGVTIFQDFGIAEPRYFHVELAAHDILLAEGLGAESYLDSGNRGFFERGSRPIELFALPDGMSRLKGRCAPLRNGGAEASAVKQGLLRRVRAMGYATARRPELRLEVDGRTVLPAAIRRGMYRFELPLHYREVRLVSQTATGGATRAGNFDPRRLGVAVLGLTQGSGGAARAVDLRSLDDGWHEPERDGARRFRWTNGDALLPVVGPGTLEITLLRPAERWVRQVDLAKLRRA